MALGMTTDALTLIWPPNRLAGAVGLGCVAGCVRGVRVEYGLAVS
jgi:hypothetical protein